MPWSFRGKCYSNVDYMQRKVNVASSSCLVTSAWPPTDSILIISSPHRETSISANTYKYIGLLHCINWTVLEVILSAKAIWQRVEHLGVGMKNTGFSIHFSFSFPPQAVYWHAIVMLVGLFFFCQCHYCCVVVCFGLGFLNISIAVLPYVLHIVAHRPSDHEGWLKSTFKWTFQKTKYQLTKLRNSVYIYSYFSHEK